MDQTFDCHSVCGLFDFFGRRVLVGITMARELTKNRHFADYFAPEGPFSSSW